MDETIQEVLVEKKVEYVTVNVPCSTPSKVQWFTVGAIIGAVFISLV